MRNIFSLKERLFGVSNPEGNHGEDVKEEYYYLASTPTHSYMKALYKYPQAAFPYKQLREENKKRVSYIFHHKEGLKEKKAQRKSKKILF